MTPDEIRAWLNDPGAGPEVFGRNWDQLCQALMWQVCRRFGSVATTYASANTACEASRIVSTDPATAEPGSFHYWAIGRHGHVALELGGGTVLMGSRHVTAWAKNAGTTTVDAYTRATGARYLGWAASNGRNTVTVDTGVSAASVVMAEVKEGTLPGYQIIAPVGLPDRGIIAPGFGVAFGDEGSFNHMRNVLGLNELGITLVGSLEMGEAERRTLFHWIVETMRTGSGPAFDARAVAAEIVRALPALGEVAVGSDSGARGRRPDGAHRGRGHEPAVTPPSRTTSVPGAASDRITRFAQEALGDLARQSWAIARTPEAVEARPGLYAIHGDERVWRELGLEYRPGIPLYAGKAERSLVGRDLHDHFAIDPNRTVNTGSSTVRRSFAALLREPLALRAVPRNLANPERFANFGLEPDADARLTGWMHEHLTLAVWPVADEVVVDLAAIERVLIRMWMPPLNVADNPGKLEQLSVARAAMAAEAAAWAARQG